MNTKSTKEEKVLTKEEKEIKALKDEKNRKRILLSKPFIYVKPGLVKGTEKFLKVRKQHSQNEFIAEDGQKVPNTVFYRRRIGRGDLVLFSPEVKKN